MAKLREELSQRVNGKEYYKYVATIPPKIVKEANWKKGQPFKAKKFGDSILLEKEKLSSHDSERKEN